MLSLPLVLQDLDQWLKPTVGFSRALNPARRLQLLDGILINQKSHSGYVGKRFKSTYRKMDNLW
jgi:hypothetical protein